MSSDTNPWLSDVDTESPITRFLDWVLDHIRENAGGLLKASELFDERKTSFGELINRPLAELGGMSCFVSLPRLQHTSGEPEASGSHVARVLVYIRSKPATTKSRSRNGNLQSFELATRLYTALDAQHFDSDPEIFAANVMTTNLITQSDKDRGIEHVFEIITTINI